MAEKGYRTAILDLTAGEAGTRGSIEERAAEAARAAEIILVSERCNAGLPDARLENTFAAKLTIAAKIRELRPQTVILPYWQARHPDHYRCSELGYESCFLAGLRKLEIAGEPHRRRKILYASLYADVKPSFVVDISAQFERRLQALLCYRSQYADRGGGAGLFPREEEEEEVAERIRAAARACGMAIDARYGEPFVLKEAMSVDDVVRLDVRSM